MWQPCSCSRVSGLVGLLAAVLAPLAPAHRRGPRFRGHPPGIKRRELTPDEHRECEARIALNLPLPAGVDDPRPAWLHAHRGASADAPENTLAAFCSRGNQRDCRADWLGLASNDPGPSVVSRAKVLGEERIDAPARVERGWLMEVRSSDKSRHQREQRRNPFVSMVVDEAVAGVRILLYVVLDSQRGQDRVEPRRCTPVTGRGSHSWRRSDRPPRGHGGHHAEGRRSWHSLPRNRVPEQVRSRNRHPCRTR